MWREIFARSYAGEADQKKLRVVDSKNIHNTATSILLQEADVVQQMMDMYKRCTSLIDYTR